MGGKFFKGLKRYFVNGLAVIFPLFVTAYAIVFVFRFFDVFSGEYINSFLRRNFNFSIPGLGFIVTILSIVIVGFLATIFIGRRWTRFFGRLFLRIPLVAGIYPAAKQLSDFLFSHNKQTPFNKVALVEFPSAGSYAMAFIVNENLEDFSRKAGVELIGVFVPSPPSPFSGFTILVPRNKIVELDISMEQAIKFIVSAGIVTPAVEKFNKKKA